MLPIQAPSIRTWLTRFPPASTTAMFIGWPISRALASAAVITRRASLREITTLSSNTRMLWQYWDALAMLTRISHSGVDFRVAERERTGEHVKKVAVVG